MASSGAPVGLTPAFSDIVDRYEGMIRKIVFEYCARHPDREDVVQEIWTKALERLTTLRDPSCVGTWLARIAHSTAIDSTRRVTRRHDLHGRLPDQCEWAVDPTINGGEGRDWRETVSHLDAAVEALPRIERRIVRQHYYHNCPCERIARYEGVSLATVKWRLARARQILRSQLVPVCLL